MTIQIREIDLKSIESFRELFRRQMNCQIVHDSIHTRLGWTKEFQIIADWETAGYGSLAVAGPWSDLPTIYEFYIIPEFRNRTFELFEAFLNVCGSQRIETQSNDALLTNMMFTFFKNFFSEAILFEDHGGQLACPASCIFRSVNSNDSNALRKNELDPEAQWLLEYEQTVVAAGGILYHYNRPYGDIYMQVSQPYRRRGYGAYLVQELKRICRERGSIPAARCNVENVASRKTLQKAGFVPCGHIVIGTRT